jgi:hypothetical protein
MRLKEIAFEEIKDSLRLKEIALKEGEDKNREKLEKANT